MNAEQKCAAVLSEARSWLKTPWHHMARVKGAGVDCAQFLIAVYSAAGLAPAFDTGYYPPDWHLHRDEPKFLTQLLKHADAVIAPSVADIAMFNFGRHAAHGGIVIEWPLIIHAYIDERMVTLSDASRGPLAQRVAGFYRLKGIEQ